MSYGFEAFMALRYLKGKRKEVFISIITVISILGVGISVMVLNIVLAIMTGFESELQKKLVDTSAPIIVRRIGGDIENWKEVEARFRDVKGITGVVPYTYNQVLLSTEGGAHGMVVRGVADLPEARAKLEKALSPDSRIEDLFSPPGYPVIRPDGSSDSVELPPLIVGASLQQRYGVELGQPLTLLTPQLTDSPQGLIPKFRRFLPVGVYSSGLVEYEGALAYTSLEAAQEFFGEGSGVTGLEVAIERLREAPQVAALIQERLRGGEWLFDVTDWTEQNRDLWEALQLEKRVYFIVLLLLILVASFSIVSSLVMIVMEKSKDIAILKTMGATNRGILRVFLFQGIIIGLLGTVIGTALGLLGCLALREFGFPINRNVFGLDYVPVYMIPTNFVVVALSAFVITSFAGVYPAWRASKLRPADSLRFE